MEIIVGIGEVKIARSGVLKTIGLGSCVGIGIYESKLKAAALAHAMLPRSNGSKTAKFVDSAVEIMVESLVALGGDKRNLIAKVAGGAQVFKHLTLENLRIGERNVEAVRETLRDRGIRLVSEDVGGNIGRTVYFFASDGRMLVRYSIGDELWI
ncbi:MAG: chemotaxis protein CheD [Archaeoglobaceae archaeon]|nr:chemotaxis protein CheD [Archaeoglobaceae archaeon]MDW7989080.1 chemotaxis protein CheD [Archaeoglobaceae archaeon]